MNTNTKRFFRIAAALALGAGASHAQNTTSFPPGYAGAAVQIVDQNGGGADIMTGTFAPGVCRVYRQSPAAFGLTSVDAWAGDALTDIEVVKLNPAFPLDIASVYGNNRLRVRYFPGGSQTITLPASFWVQKVKSLDIEGDGDNDLAVCGRGNSQLYYTRNAGASFGVAQTHPNLTCGSSRPQCFTVGDFNHDGKPDFIVPMASGNVRYMRNTSTSSPSWAAPQQYANPNTRPWDVCADDFNGDGWLDFATANSIGSVSIWLNNGPTGATWNTVNFTLSTITLGTSNNFPASIACRDRDCDGDVDLFVALRLSNQVRVLRNNGSGSFSLSSLYTTPTGPTDIAVGDLQNDVDTDFATANKQTTTRWLLGGGTYKRHFYVGGISDNFSGATPAGFEHACPRPGAFTSFAAPLRHFDQPSCIRKFAHSFPHVAAGKTFPDRIVAARLSMRIRGDCSSANNDRFGLAFENAFGGRMVFQTDLTDLATVPATYGSGTSAGISLDLAALPGGLNLLPWINANDSLDVFLENGSRVDSISLQLTTCTRVRCTYSQKQTPFVAGTNWTIAGGGAPAGSILLFFASPDVGPRPVLPGGQFCLVPPIFYLGAVSAPSGSGSLKIPLPPSLPGPCVTLSTQSIAFPSFCYSNTWTAQFFN